MGPDRIPHWLRLTFHTQASHGCCWSWIRSVEPISQQVPVHYEGPFPNARAPADSDDIPADDLEWARVAAWGNQNSCNHFPSATLNFVRWDYFFVRLIISKQDVKVLDSWFRRKTGELLENSFPERNASSEESWSLKASPLFLRGRRHLWAIHYPVPVSLLSALSVAPVLSAAQHYTAIGQQHRISWRNQKKWKTHQERWKTKGNKSWIEK